MRTPLIERMMAPVTPWELWFALRIMDALGSAGNNTGMHPEAYRYARESTALMDIIEGEKAASLHFRAYAFRDVMHDERSKGHDVRLLIFVAADLRINDQGGFDLDEFFQKVKEVTERYSVDEIVDILSEGRQETLEHAALDYLNASQINRLTRPPRITGNDYCPCKSGKKYKKCHGLPS